jgi:hypothetical protein
MIGFFLTNAPVHAGIDLFTCSRKQSAKKSDGKNYCDAILHMPSMEALEEDKEKTPRIPRISRIHDQPSVESVFIRHFCFSIIVAIVAVWESCRILTEIRNIRQIERTSSIYWIKRLVN